MTEQEFVAAAWSGTHTFHTVGKTSVLIRSHQNLADAMFIHNGVLFEIVGPGLTVPAASKLSDTLVEQLP